MPLDYYELKNMRNLHPAWRLMAAEHAPFIAGFLDLVFSDIKIRQIRESEIHMKLEDYLYTLRETDQEDRFARDTSAYLAEWSRNDRGWLRKFYLPGYDEPYYDLTPESEKALGWMRELFNKNFIGTESRLYSSIDLLKQIAHGLETDKDIRIERLEARKKKIDEEIQAVKDGNLSLLDDREVRERFIQFEKMSREILGDFRAVEQNFRNLDRKTREKITSWNGDKSSLLKALFGERDSISDSDEGRSFNAFWNFLLSSDSQEELSELLDKVCSIEQVREIEESSAYKRIHFDWMLAGERTQRTVARLSQQLRRFLDDKAYYENRRISSLLDSIESNALELRDDQPDGDFMEMEGWKPEIRMPMELPLFSPPYPEALSHIMEDVDLSGLDTEVLFNQTVVDKKKLKLRINRLLKEEAQVTLSGVLVDHPLEEGLAELIMYITIAEESPYSFIDERETDFVTWMDKNDHFRRAGIHRIVYHRKGYEQQ